jgi:hypothetical protein
MWYIMRGLEASVGFVTYTQYIIKASSVDGRGGDGLIIKFIFFPLLTCLLCLRVIVRDWGEKLAEDGEESLWVIGCDGGPHLLALEHKLDELGLVLAVGVKGEPVVEVLAAGSPTMGGATCLLE